MKTLIVMAMPEEGQGRLEELGAKVIYTGLGKVNATYHLVKSIDQDRPDLIINFGTAGSSKYRTGALVECTEFIQRDMDLTGIGVPFGVTAFDKYGGQMRVPSKFKEMEQGICGSGDSFDTSGGIKAWNVVDMEAYALAKICRIENISFVCVKYISDGADASAHSDWKSSLPKAAAAFEMIFKQFWFFNQQS